MNILRMIPVTLLIAVLVSASTTAQIPSAAETTLPASPGQLPSGQRSPVRDPEMMRFLESRLQTLRENQDELKKRVATDPSAQNELNAMEQEMVWLQQSIGPNAVPQQVPQPSDFLAPDPLFSNPRRIPQTTDSISSVPSMSPFTGMNPQMLGSVRQQLMAELKNVQSVLGMVDPNDTQFAAHLQKQQSDLLKQIKDIDRQITGTQPVAPQGMPPVPPQTIGTMPPFSNMPGNTEIQNWAALQNQPPVTLPNPNAEKIKSLQNAAEQLRLAGQHIMADQALREAEQLKLHGMLLPVAPQAAPYNPENAAFASTWMPQPSKEIIDLKSSVESLRREIEEMRTSLKSLEAQLQLLNRNTVHEAGRLDQILQPTLPNP